MDLYFAGAEQPIYLRQLDELGVSRIAISFFEWQRRHSTDDLYKHVPKDMEVIVTPGVARKTDIDFKAFCTDYLEFCERNADQVLMFDLDAPACPAKLRGEVRAALSILPNVIMFPDAGEDLHRLAGQYERIGLNARRAKSMSGSEMRRIPATLFGSNITDPKILRIGKFAASTTFAWMSGKRYGELWIFARNQLHHYSAENLVKAVRRHSRDIEAFGLDPVAAAGNDRDVLTAIAVRSLQAAALNISKRPRDREIVEVPDASANGGNGKAVDGGALTPAALMAGNGVLPLNERDRVMLPVISTNPLEDTTKVTSITSSLRRCDSCYLSDVCPKFVPESSCAYEIPIEIKTDEQWEAASQVLLEIQFQRVAFARFAEEVEGGVINPAVGREMDRFQKLLGSVKELKSATPAPGGGVMQRIFGAPAEPEEMEGPTNDGQEGEWDEEDEYAEAEIVSSEEYGEEEYARLGFADQEEG